LRSNRREREAVGNTLSFGEKHKLHMASVVCLF